MFATFCYILLKRCVFPCAAPLPVAYSIVFESVLYLHMSYFLVGPPCRAHRAMFAIQKGEEEFLTPIWVAEVKVKKLVMLDQLKI